ncbi:hypothetical protein N7488_005107 [Penicillium malachiteum]|nr:hypothetical protein N7488_005107 [Penicillium malachiteum]
MASGRLIACFLVQAAVACDQQRIYVRRTCSLDLRERERDETWQEWQKIKEIEKHQSDRLSPHVPSPCQLAAPFHPEFVRRTSPNLTIDMRDVIFYTSEKLWINTACFFEIFDWNG